MTLLFAIAAVGIVGAIWLSRKYNGKLARILLLITGSASLWMLLIMNYAVLVENPVPQLIGFVVLPLLSVLSIWLAIRNFSTLDDKEKRKLGES